jgi:hypothetical protein
MDAARGNGGGPTHLCRSIVTLTIGLSAVVFLGIGTAYPHEPKRPELNAWFKSLKNKAGKPGCAWSREQRSRRALTCRKTRSTKSGEEA